MKLLWVYVLVAFTVPAIAAEKKSENPQIAFSVTSSDFEELNIRRNADVGLQLFASNLGVKSSTQPHLYNQLYTTKKMKSWVYIQANMYIGDKKAGDITTMPDGKSYFFVKRDTNFFVLTYGLKSDDVIKLRKEMMLNAANETSKTAQTERTSKILSLADYMLGKQTVLAADDKCLSSPKIQERLQANSESDFKVLKAAANCVNGAGAGVWNATGGAVEFMYNVATKGTEQIACGAASIVNATWKRCGEYADAMRNSVDTTMNALGNIKEVASAAIDGFTDLPAEAQAAVLCEMGSTVATGVAVTFATSGAGAPVALAKISEVLNKVAEMPGMSKSAGTLKNMAAKVEQKAEARSIAHTTSKTMPYELKTSLAKIEDLKSQLAKNAVKQDEAVAKTAIANQKLLDNPSAAQAEIIVSNYARDLKDAVEGTGSKLYTHEESKEILKKLMSYQKLDSYHQKLAEKILSSDKKGVMGVKMSDDLDLNSFNLSYRDLQFKINPDLKVNTPEASNKLRSAIGENYKVKFELEEKAHQLQEKLTGELTRYRELVDKKLSASEADKDIYRAQVATYRVAVVCNTVGAAKSNPTTPDNSPEAVR